jgi:DNA-binding transcriptional LysR family regulator
VQLHQLCYVVCVAEEGRFTRAAARLHVAQPSVSSAVAALEPELGAPLFHRARHQVVLTGAGLVPESVVPADGPLRAVRFRGAALGRRIGLASRRDRPLSPPAQAFVAALNGHLARSTEVALS